MLNIKDFAGPARWVQALLPRSWRNPEMRDTTIVEKRGELNSNRDPTNRRTLSWRPSPNTRCVLEAGRSPLDDKDALEDRVASSELVSVPCTIDIDLVETLGRRALRGGHDEDQYGAEDLALACTIIGVDDFPSFEWHINSPAAVASRFLHHYWIGLTACDYPEMVLDLKPNIVAPAFLDKLTARSERIRGGGDKLHIEDVILAKDLTRALGSGLPVWIELVSVETQTRIAARYLNQMHGFLNQPRGWESITHSTYDQYGRPGHSQMQRSYCRKNGMGSGRRRRVMALFVPTPPPRPPVVRDSIEKEMTKQINDLIYNDLHWIATNRTSQKDAAIFKSFQKALSLT